MKRLPTKKRRQRFVEAVVGSGIDPTFLPWRVTTEPYAVLIAELLLQRTQAVQVVASFDRLLSRYPLVADLAVAEPAELKALLHPLGLVKRAGMLQRMAQSVVARFDGSVPTNVEALMSLPGVGEYAAAATACFAGGEARAIVDANVIRVFSRYFGFESQRPRPRTDRALWELAAWLIPETDAAAYNRALLDFGRMVCRAQSPKCQICPLASDCKYLRSITRLH